MPTSDDFSVPLTVFADGRLQLICSVEDAEQFLFDHLAENDTRLWRIAMKHCIVSELGAVTVEEVRLAFVDAAKDAGFRIFGEWSLL